ncbi:MAG: GNAT family N-acetyltransferase [Alphaproteobacteria bacterium]|nr:GNAT family N-acetyltransferase [Alphaproteobacteria bacterium]MBU1280806.1 GNAT family N-acetyltransferase [Alphaproteobacteria bacterium]MBU1575230.1 GNAT family N-acetyltransferase [Alphaproteobacteria bacterium]MBU1830046.1 GNAT family N-acetyltransferase [Alphaproteobacteria bacterium]MBU2076712.1 GNAT family N-acetyltransferase [Alphaproteobacteria bacterium]
MTRFSADQAPQNFILRQVRQEDRPTLIQQLNDPRIAPWLAAVPQPFGPSEADALLAHGQHSDEHLLIVEQGGAVAGCLCIGASLWYWLDPAFWGRGLMHHALQTAVATHFATLAPPLTATCHTDNAASQAVLTRLGFSPTPTLRKMFFQSAQSAQLCRDFVMTPEQWHLLHPPLIALNAVSLRPAEQKDAATLVRMLPHAGSPIWPTPETIRAFIETHRFRGPPRGLFVILDAHRRSLGMALLTENTPALCFLSEEDAARHHDHVTAALAQGIGSVQSFRCE